MQIQQLTHTSTVVALYTQGTSLNILGMPGIGKSSIVRNMVRILSDHFGEEFGYVEHLVPTIESSDVRGFMIPTKDSHQRPVSLYARPAILPSDEYFAQHPRGIAFFDEFELGDMLTKKALGQTVLERIVGDYRFPPGWWIITASNRTQDRSGVGQRLAHLENRRRTVELTSDVFSWGEWAASYVSPRTGLRFHPLGLAFAEKNPGVIFTDAVPTEPGPFCTPRSYTAALELLTALSQRADGTIDRDFPSGPTVQELVAGDIGKGAAAQLFAFAKVAEHLPTMEDLLAKPGEAKCPGGERLDAAYAAAHMVLHAVRTHGLGNLWDYATRMPQELQVMMARRIMKESSGEATLFKSPSFRDWVKKNAQLVAEVGRDVRTR